MLAQIITSRGIASVYSSAIIGCCRYVEGGIKLGLEVIHHFYAAFFGIWLVIILRPDRARSFSIIYSIVILLVTALVIWSLAVAFAGRMDRAVENLRFITRLAAIYWKPVLFAFAIAFLIDYLRSIWPALFHPQNPVRLTSSLYLGCIVVCWVLVFEFAHLQVAQLTPTPNNNDVNKELRQ
jgi:hypothetical protein